MRLIDADALWMDVIHAMDYCEDILEIIEKQPTVEERKTGKWKISDLPKGKMKYCSECGYGQFMADIREYNFCPNCGAKMEGGKDE